MPHTAVVAIVEISTTACTKKKLKFIIKPANKNHPIFLAISLGVGAHSDQS
jgi:hypothetical protein